MLPRLKLNTIEDLVRSRALFLFFVLSLYPLTSSTVGEIVDGAVEVDLTQQVECRSVSSDVLERVVLWPADGQSHRQLQVQFFRRLEPVLRAKCEITNGKYVCDWQGAYRISLELTSPTPVIVPLGDQSYRVRLHGEYLKNYSPKARLSCSLYSF